MWDLTRRECLIQLTRSLSVAGAAFAAQLPPGFSTPAMPACDPSTKPTPARTPAARQTGAPGRKLSLDGAVIGIRCGLVAGATVTASIGDTHAVATTNAAGRYHVDLVLPKIAAAPRINIKVDVPAKPDGRKRTTLTTSLFLPDEIAHAENAKAAGFDPLLRMKLVKQTPDVIQAGFDVILDL